MLRVLLVDDDESVTYALSFLLGKEGFEVAVAREADQALELFEERPADLVVLDVALNGRSGWELCSALRERSNVPLVIVSGENTESDKVLGLDLGADDYITKPFATQELLSRFHAVLRRSRPPAPAPTLESGPVRLDVDRREVLLHGSRIELSVKQFHLLELLMRKPGGSVLSQVLWQECWGPDRPYNRKLLTRNIERLRDKLEPHAESPRLIVSVRKLGFRFVGDV